MIRLSILLAIALAMGHADGFTFYRPSLYQYASLQTGVNADILQGIAKAESDETDSAIGDDGISMGRFQINERYHEARAAAWGEYDPFKPMQAAMIAGNILVENAAYFAKASRVCDPSTWAERRNELTIASYRQGIGGVNHNGATYWYVGRVRSI